MASHLVYLNYFNLKKAREVQPRLYPYDELDDVEFRRRFRLTKPTTLLLLSQVNYVKLQPPTLFDLTLQHKLYKKCNEMETIIIMERPITK